MRKFEVETSTGEIIKGYTYDEYTFHMKGYDGRVRCEILSPCGEEIAVKIWEARRDDYIKGFSAWLEAGGSPD
jgi:hypothetical protein